MDEFVVIAQEASKSGVDQAGYLIASKVGLTESNLSFLLLIPLLSCF